MRDLSGRIIHVFWVPVVMLLALGTGQAVACNWRWWFPDPPIEVDIVGPSVVCPGAIVQYYCADVLDLDYYELYDKHDNLLDTGYAQDSIDPDGYTWEATCGTLSGDLTSSCVTWQAPTSPTTCTIKCKANDLPLEVWPPDIGSRDDPESDWGILQVRVNTPPSVTIAKPACEDEYVGGVTFVKAYVTAYQRTDRVEFYVDQWFGGYMYEESGYWRYDWDASPWSRGYHTIKLRAYDNYGCYGEASRRVFCNPRVEMDQIRWRNDHTLWNRADDEEITEPQWTQEVTKPFAYTIGQQMTCDVHMTSPDITESVQIRYVVDAYWSDEATYNKEKTTTSSFPCWLAHYPDARERVKDYSMSQWYDFFVRKCVDSEWCPAGSQYAAHYQIYLTFDDPVGPWGTTQNPRACWSRVIKTACEWMPSDGYDAQHERDAMKRLAYKAYFSGGMTYGAFQSHYDELADSVRFYLWNFVNQDTADCQDMSLWWEKLCHSVGTSAYAKRIGGPFDYQDILPVGWGGWGSGSWSFHHIGWDNNVFDPCVQLDSSSPRVPQDENIDDPYKADLYSSGTWNPLSGFKLGDQDPHYSKVSEVD